jgi:hypothetical protein
MKSFVIRALPVLTAAVFAAVLVMPLLGRGEDASTALDEYAPYLPGNPVPASLICQSDANYFEEYQTRCRANGGTYCEYGQVMADRGLIAQATFYGCRFPIAYLMAEYGPYRSSQRYTRSVILRWYSANIQVSSIGWLDAMHTVQTVTWWRRDDSMVGDS